MIVQIQESGVLFGDIYQGPIHRMADFHDREPYQERTIETTT